MKEGGNSDEGQKDQEFMKLRALIDAICKRNPQSIPKYILMAIEKNLNAIKESPSGAERLRAVSKQLELNNLSADDIKSTRFSPSVDLEQIQKIVFHETNKGPDKLERIDNVIEENVIEENERKKLNPLSLFLEKLSQLAHVMKEGVSKASSYRSSVQSRLFEYANVMKAKAKNALFCLRRKDSANEGDRNADSSGDQPRKRL